MNSTEEKLENKVGNLKELTNFLKAPQFNQSHIKPTLVVFIILIALLSIFSNSLIILVVRGSKHMRTTTNYLIMNMACGDLLVTIVTSLNNINRLYNGMQWIGEKGGNLACQTKYYVVFVAMFCSIYSLVAITFDRFMAVTRPLKYKSLLWWTKYALPVVWMASLALPSQLVFNKFAVVKYDALQNNKSYCVPLKSVNEGAVMTVCGYVIPHVVVVILYAIIGYKLWTRRIPGDQGDAQRQSAAQKTAKKVTRMVVCVIIVFEICWTPLFSLNVLPCLIPYFRKVHRPLVTSIVTIAMSANGIFNALIYFSFCGNFRSAMKTVFLFGTRREGGKKNVQNNKVSNKLTA